MAAVLLAAAAECGHLSSWQLGKLAARRARAARQSEARARPTVEIAALRGAGADSIAGRRVHARGRYDQTCNVLLRGRSWQGEPGVEVVTPLVIEGEPVAVLVNRGWLPASDGATVRVADYPESGWVEVLGIVEPGQEFPDQGAPSTGQAGGPTYMRLDIRTAREKTPYPLVGFTLRQLPDPSWKGYPRRVDRLETGDGPHLSYGIQWILFCLLFLGGAFMVLFSPPRPRGST